METPPVGSISAERLSGEPIIFPGMKGLEGEAGANINGPSLVIAPPWLERPLGRYYLYFAHHRGRSIRLATADCLAGPWQVLPGGALHIEQTPFDEHIASPDVHLDEAGRKVILYFHGKSRRSWDQPTYAATSNDGVNFQTVSPPLGPPYFRRFLWGSRYFAFSKIKGSAQILHSTEPCSGFVKGPELIPRCRHTAVVIRSDTLYVFFSRIGDAPEQILCTTVKLNSEQPDDWMASQGPVIPVLDPGLEWEGTCRPVTPSKEGPAPATGARELRDPACFQEDGESYLLYSGAGELGIGIARLSFATSG